MEATKKNTLSKSEIRRREAMKGESQSSAKPLIESGNTKIKAVRDTQLPDGTFVKKGNVVEVDSRYADLVTKEKPVHFVRA